MFKLKDKFKLNKKSALEVKEEKGINPIIIYIFLIILGLVLGYLVQFTFYRPDFGVFLSSDMDPGGNIYVLGVNTDVDKYKVTKVNSVGQVQFQMNLESSTDKIQNTYRFIESDSKGNFYIVKEERDIYTVANDKSEYPILRETVLMYDTGGNYVKQVASADFSQDASPPIVPYIRKLQIVGQKITLVCAIDNTYRVITADPMQDKQNEELKIFSINPVSEQVAKNVDWVQDIAVLSNGRVIYSTKSGKFYAMDNQSTFLDYTEVVSRDTTLLTGFSVDEGDNLYFTDALSGNFYKMDTRSISTTNIYQLESGIVPNTDIKIKDLRTPKLISIDDYYAPSKDFSNPYHVRFGANSLVVKNITGAFIPGGLLITIVVMAAVIGLYFLIKLAIRYEIKRIPLAIRITGLFFPIFLVSMLVLLFITVKDASDEYVKVLKNDEDIGAKIAADHIDGDLFFSLDHTGDYMNTNYMSLNNMMQEAYNDIASKIGDRSDYVVAYVVKNNKIYSTFSSKYKAESESYESLKYTNPDMITNNTMLVDYALERSETEKIYNAWKSFTSEIEVADIVRIDFDDVYGDLSASFAPIKTRDNKIVGFVGNFIDGGVHKDRKIRQILEHSSSAILITAVLVFGYMCLIVKYSLRPIKVLEKSINAMGKGIWNTRARVTSKDEFADIAETFNLMSAKMDKYTSNLMLLNEKYVKYAPSEIFKLIGKDKITSVHLHDYKVLNMNILYLTFNISCQDTGSFSSEKELFDLLNASYEAFFNVAEKNRGVVHIFSSIEARILFPHSAEDAFNAAMQFKEVFINDKIRETINLTLGSGEVLLGISGNAKRRGVLTVSDQVMQLFNIDRYLRTLKINHVATDSFIAKLPQTGLCNYRYIGKIGKVYSHGSIGVYEIIDMSNQYRKDLYINTKELFESAVKVYRNCEFIKARKMFADVLKINSKDAVSIHYLMRCDEQINGTDNKFNKKEWTGNLFD